MSHFVSLCTALCLLLSLLPQNGGAQELRTNDKGEKIIVYPDGSWRYFNDPLGNNTLYDKDGNPIPVGQQPLADQPTVAVPDRAELLTEEAYKKIVVNWRDKRRMQAELERQLAEHRGPPAGWKVVAAAAPPDALAARVLATIRSRG